MSERLSEAREGDSVFSAALGECTILKVNEEEVYGIRVNYGGVNHFFSRSGRVAGDPHATLFNSKEDFFKYWGMKYLEEKNDTDLKSYGERKKSEEAEEKVKEALQEFKKKYQRMSDKMMAAEAELRGINSDMGDYEMINDYEKEIFQGRIGNLADIMDGDV